MTITAAIHGERLEDIISRLCALLKAPAIQGSGVAKKSALQNSHSAAESQRTWFVVIDDGVSAR